MRILLIITSQANIAFAFSSLPWLPNPMANHFALDGTPNRFESPIVNAVAVTILIGFITVFVLIMSSSIPKLLPRFGSIPNRDYWLREENRPKAVRYLAKSLERVAFGTMLFFLLFQWEIFQANQTVPPGKLNFDVTFSCNVLFAFIIVEIVRLYLMFRLTGTTGIAAQKQLNELEFKGYDPGQQAEKGRSQ